MKKSLKTLFKIIICFIVILPITFISVACSNNSGKSAYELAVENGFVGTLDEWLNSLKGSNGQNGKDKQGETSYEMWEKAHQEGSFTGTYLDFLETYFLYDDATFATNKALSSVVEISTGLKSGSGVIYSIDNDNNAFIITNYHVIHNAPSCKIKLYGTNDSDKFTATVVGGSETYDIAVLYAENCELLNTANACAATFKLETPLLGSTCIAIGNANGEGTNVAKGCIRKDCDYVQYTPVSHLTTHRLLGHDAYMIYGNSGGGLFDLAGNLIGITNCGADYKNGIDDSGMKFAIPASIVYSVTRNIIENCFGKSNQSVILCNLGLTFSSSTSRQINSTTGLTETIDTVKISSINNPNITNIQVGDQLVSFKITTENETIEKQIKRSFELEDYLPLLTNNTQLELKFQREGQTQLITLNLSFDDLSCSPIS